MVDFAKILADESAPDSAKAVALLSRIADTLDALREDLKRRSERDLKAAGAIPANAPGKAPSGGGATLPNYGRRKGEPIVGCPLSDLEYYAAGCRRTLDDPSKSRWHGKERDTLAAIEAEIARQRGGSSGGGDSPPDFFGGGGPEDDIPFTAIDGRIP
jgi:hypothetical protein